MRLCRMMAPAVLAALVSACSINDNPAPVVRTVIVQAEIAPEAKKPCADPVSLPDRDLTDSETQTNWGADRTALRICKARHAAAVGGPH